MSHTHRPRFAVVPLLLLGLLVTASACGPVYVARPASYQQTRSATVAHQTASSGQWGYLDAHGYWVVTANHGRVWVPSANQDVNWRPYYYGKWDHTEYGWTWVSSESWGWGPYHYGRWTWHTRHHWVWVPGHTWGPAWVSWRSGGGCVGWAPLGPGGGGVAHHTFWVFVPQGRVYRSNVASVVVRPGRAQVVYNQSVHIGVKQKIRDHRGGVTTYNRGPSAAKVTTWTRRPVRTTSINTIPSAVRRIRRAPRRPARPAYNPRNGTTPRRAVPAYRGPRRAAPVASPRRPTLPTYRPAPKRVAPAYRAPSYRVPGARVAPAYRPAPKARPVRPYVRPSPAYRAPTRTAPVYRPPTRPAPSRAAPTYGRTAPRADSRSTPNSVKPRSSSSSSSSRSKRRVRRKRPAPTSRRTRSRDR
jgi:hypothetical protein